MFDRFIPAYAGNSETLKMGAAALSVHPRLRGELVRTLAERKRAGGSSPLTRGTLNCSRQGGSNLSVHPRLRGEL